MGRPNPHGLLMSSSPAALCGRILPRLEGGIRHEVFADGSAPGLVAYAIAHGSAEELVVLAKNPAVAPDDLALLAAHTSEPQQAEHLFANSSAPREAMVRVMPFAAGSLLPTLLDRKDALRFDAARCASVAVESEDPRVVRSALLVVDGDFLPLSPAVVLRGCLGLLWADGREAASQALRDVRDLVVGDLSAPVRDAFADPFAPASLGRALAYESSPPVLLEHLRRCRGRDEALVRLYAPRDAIDWAFVVEAHRHEPLPGFVLAALARQVGCPDVLRTPSPEQNGTTGGRPGVVRPKAVPREPQDVRLGELDSAAVAALAHEYYLTGVLSASAILREGRPASAAFEIIASSARERDHGVARAVAELTRPVLGEDADAWVVALNLLGDFVGTLPELVRTASAVAQ